MLIVVINLSTGIVVGIKKSEKVTLLTVSKDNNGSEIGGTVELEVRILKGNGRVFVNTYPLIRLDTQESFRMAMREACYYSDTDCSKYDFYYTIITNSPMVSGPSAGGFAALTTLAMLKNRNIREDLAMTGTISSGGVIGRVEGIKEKVEAARRIGKRIILVPKLGLMYKEGNQTKINKTFIDEEKKNGVKVIPVENLLEAYKIATGEDLASRKVDIPDYYYEKMVEISNDICNRTRILLEETSKKGLDNSEAIEKYNEALTIDEPYVKASICFSANVMLRESLNSTTREMIEGEIKKVEKMIDSISIDNWNNLETVLVAKERIREARKVLNNESKFGYAYERVYSAKEWLKMADDYNNGHNNNYDKNYERNIREILDIKKIALSKILEGEEKTSLIIPLTYDIINPQEQKQELDDAINLLEKDPAMAYYIASKAVAETNLYLSLWKMDTNLTDELVKEKLKCVENYLSKSFSFMAYNYYQYAKYWLDKDPNLALMYSEYALEFGKIPVNKHKEEVDRFWKAIIIFLIGVTIGIIIRNITTTTNKNNKKNNNRKR